MIKIQADKDTDDKKIQSSQEIRVFDAKTQKELEQMRSQTQLTIAQMNIEKEKELERMRMMNEQQLAIFNGNNKLTDESKSLEVKKIELGYEEQMLNFNKKLEQMVDQHRKTILDDTQGKQDHLVKAVSDNMTQMPVEIKGLAQLLDEIKALMSQQMVVQMQTKEGLLNPKEREVKLSNISVGKDGLITGATVTKSLQ